MTGIGQMEAADLLVEAVEKATALGYTIGAANGMVDVLPWAGKPLVRTDAGDRSIFETEHLLNLIDWLDGVAHGRTSVRL